MQATRNRKWYAFSLFILLGFCGVIYFLRHIPQKQDQIDDPGRLIKEKGYFVPLKIQGFTFANIPYLEVTIENQKVPTEIDLGYSGMLSLSSDIIKEIIKKNFIKKIRTYGFRGKTYENDLYEVEKIATESMTFFPVKIQEKNEEFERELLVVGEKKESSINHRGSIGWHLFYNFNLLVDCKHSTFALCDSLDTLKQQGYPVDSFIETSLLLDRDCIDFEAITEAGPLRCMLDTGCTFNLLNKDLETGRNEHMIFTGKDGDQSFLNPENKDLLTFDLEDTQQITHFTVGGKEFGPLTFNRIKSPIAVDAVIGMQFIDYALIFIDFSNRKIYFFEYPPEEEVPSTEFLVKEDRLLFLRLLSPRSRLPTCGISPPHPTCFCLLNMRLPAFLALTPSNVSHLSLTPPFNSSAIEPIGS